jgi:hypothetical protein
MQKQPKAGEDEMTYEPTHEDDMERLLVDAMQALERFEKQARYEKLRPGNVTLVKDIERKLEQIKVGQF